VVPKVPAPPVYRPQPPGNFAQPKINTPLVPRPPAPPVYRPQVAGNVSQPKTGGPMMPRTPAPPVYRPQAAGNVGQSRVGIQMRPGPPSPPVYRPQAAGAIAQPKAGVPIASKAPAPPVYKPQTAGNVTNPKSSKAPIIPKTPTPWVYRRQANSASVQRKSGAANALRAGLTAGHARVIQRIIYGDIDELLTAVVHANNAATGAHGAVPDVTDFDPHLQQLFTETEALLPMVDVTSDPTLGRVAEASQNDPTAAHPYDLVYQPNTADQEFLIASVLHELMHVASEEYYDKGGHGTPYGYNMNIPRGGNPRRNIAAQTAMLDRNLADAEGVANGERNALGANLQAHVLRRLAYAREMPSVHYESVLADIMAYMELQVATNSNTYRFIRRLIAESTDRRTRTPWWGVIEARRVRSNASWYQFWEW